MWRQPVIKLVLIALALVAIGVMVLLWTQRARASIGNLQVYQGLADIVRHGQSISGSTGVAIQLGDTLKVAASSRVAIILKDSSVIRLEADTEVEVARLDYQGQKIKDAIFQLKLGRLWSRVAPLEPAGQFEVETPTAVAAVAGTSYNSNYRDSTSGFYVDRDSVSVALKTNRGETKKIKTGFIIRLKDDQLDQDFQAGPKLPEPAFFDDWIIFNQAEDDKICQAKSDTPGCREQSPRYTAQASALPVPDSSQADSTPQSQPVQKTEPIKTLTRSSKQPTVLGVQADEPVPTQPIPPPPLPPPIVEAPVTPSQSHLEPTSPQLNPTNPVLPQPPPAPEPPPPPAPERILLAIRLSADRTQILTDETIILSATAQYSDNSAADVSNQVAWAIKQGSGNFQANKFTATAAGQVKLSASYQTIVSNELTITVAKRRQLVGLKLTYSQTVDQREFRQAQFHAFAVFDDQSEEEVIAKIQWSLVKPIYGRIDDTGVYTAGQPETVDTVVGQYANAQGSLKISL